LELPPRGLELNPVERIWHYLRSHWLANSVFISLADVMDACEMAWNRFATNHGLIRSLCAVAWAPASPPLKAAPASGYTHVSKFPQIRYYAASSVFSWILHHESESSNLWLITRWISLID
jgi:hypothetical protein